MRYVHGVFLTLVKKIIAETFDVKVGEKIPRGERKLFAGFVARRVVWLYTHSQFKATNGAFWVKQMVNACYIELRSPYDYVSQANHYLIHKIN